MNLLTASPAAFLPMWPSQGCPLSRAGRLPLHTCCAAAKKGFGTGLKPRKDDDEDVSSGSKGRVRRIRQRQQEPTPFRDQQTPGGALANVQLRRVEELEEQVRRESEDEDFLQRLEVIKLEGREKARELPRSTTGGTAGTTKGAAFDGASHGAAVEDIYANPPSLGDTLLNQMNSEISDPALRSAKIGPGQLGLAVGALALGLIIVVVSGADYSTSKRFKGVRPRAPPPDGIEAKLLASKAATLSAKLEESPDDLNTIEALAVTQAKLYNFPEATRLLDKLVAARPDDVEAWRLLGEAQLLNAQTGKSVAAFEKAAALRAEDLQILTGLVDAYIANGQQKQAADYLVNLRQTLATKRIEQASSSSRSNSKPSASSSIQPASSSSSSSRVSGGGSDASPAASIAASEVAGTLQAPPLVGSAGSNSAEAAGIMASSSDSGAASSSDQQAGNTAAKPQLQARPIDPVAVDLLLGKTYAAWRGHDTDASAAYDDLIRAYPEDFRGYLAKGVFLKEKGRKGDAERMFIQAKFYAPSDALRAFVAQKAGESPATELPDNGLE